MLSDGDVQAGAVKKLGPEIVREHIGARLTDCLTLRYLGWSGPSWQRYGIRPNIRQETRSSQERLALAVGGGLAALFGAH